MKKFLIPLFLLLLMSSFAYAETLSYKGAFDSHIGLVTSFSIDTIDNTNEIIGGAYQGSNCYLYRINTTDDTLIESGTTQIAQIGGQCGITTGVYSEDFNKYYYYDFTDQTIAKLNSDFTLDTAYSGVGNNIISMTHDSSYIYALRSNGQISRYDQNINLVSTIDISSQGVPILGNSAIDHVDGLFYIRTSNTLYVISNSFNYLGITHELQNLGTVAYYDMVNNGTEIYIYNQINENIYRFDMFTPPEIVVLNYTSIHPTGNTINLNDTFGFPESFAQDINYNYILDSEDVVSRFTLNDFTFYDNLCADISNATDWKFIGKYEDNILMRQNEFQVLQMQESDCTILQTRTLDNVNIGSDLKVIGESLYVLSSDKRIVVYDILENSNGIIDYLYQREFSLDNDLDYNVSYITGYENNVFVLDTNTLSLLHYDSLGFSINKYTLENFTSVVAKDLFFYQDDFYVIDYTNKQAVEYNLSQPTTNNSFGGVQYGNEYCTDQNTLCSNPIYAIQGEGLVVTCADDISKTWCSDSCSNTVVNSSNVATCTDLISCTDECAYPNVDICQTPNTYGDCVLNENTGCTELFSGLFCQANTVCETTEIGAQCVAINYTETGLYNQPFINVDVEVVSSNAFNTVVTEVEEGFEPTTFFIASVLGLGPSYLATNIYRSVFSTLEQDLQVEGISELQPALYSAYSCDFIENYLDIDYIDDLNTWSTSGNIVNLEGYTYLNVTSSTNKTLVNTQLSQEIEILFVPKNGSSYIYFYDDPYLIEGLEITYNENTLEFSIKDTAYSQVLVNETGILEGGQDTLSRVALINTFLKETNAYTLQAVVIRESNNIETEQIYYTLPLGYVQTQAISPSRIRFQGDINVYQVIQIETEGYGVYSLDNSVTCEYSGLECYKQRFWSNTQGISTYHFYEERQTCVQELNGTSTTGDNLGVVADDDLDALESLFGEPFTKNEKTLIAIITVLAVFGVFAGIFYQTNERIMLFTGVISGFLIAFGFAIFGYIPAWVLIIAGIVATWVTTRSLIGGGGV